MATSSITRSAAAIPPLDQALSSVRVAAYDLVGPVASCLTNAAAVAESSFSGTTCVAIPSAPASRPEIGSPSMANRDARARPALRNPLHSPRNGQHRRRDLDAAKHRIFGCEKKVASQRKLKPAAERDA